MAHTNNDGKHVESIINRKICTRHSAPLGIPCFSLFSSVVDYLYPAICNHRAVAAGANGKITESSFQIKRKQETRFKAKGRP